MITIRKLKTLKAGTLKRKTAVLLQAFEEELQAGRSVNNVYLQELLKLISEAFSESRSICRKAEEAEDCTVRKINSLRHEILKELGAEPADWDLDNTHSPVAKTGGTGIKNYDDFNLRVFLDDIRSPFNLGSIFRTAEAFGIKKIFLSEDCPSPAHPRAVRSSMGCTDMIEWEYRAKEDVFRTGSAFEPFFALELGGSPLAGFRFPSAELLLSVRRSSV